MVWTFLGKIVITSLPGHTAQHIEKVMYMFYYDPCVIGACSVCVLRKQEKYMLHATYMLNCSCTPHLLILPCTVTFDKGTVDILINVGGLCR